jgi:hypothetical protein
MKKTFLLFSWVPVFLCSGCSGNLANYEDVLTGEPVNTPVYQLAPSFLTNFSTKSTGEVKVRLSWQFADNLLFFPSDSELSRSDVKQLMKSLGLSQDIEESRSSCNGTSFFTWTKKLEVSPVMYSFKTDGITGDTVTPFLFCELQQHTLKSKDGSKKDIVYFVSDYSYVSYIAQ